MSGLPFTKAHLLELEKFVALIKADPQILYNPELKFFKNFVESLGGTLPPLNKPNVGGDAPGVGPTKTPKKPEPEPNPEEESEESDIELDVSGVVEPDIEEPQAMGDSDKEVSEEDIEISNAKKREAISAYSDGDYEKAIQIYTEAILLNPASALLYAKRGQAYLQLNKPNACIRDCSRALQINPDSAAAYKFRGRAHRLLGHWEEAAKDLRESCKLDFDEQADEWLREVTPNVLQGVQLQGNEPDIGLGSS
uniref:Hsp70-interacting protein N-terminal domain-containing protein n=1 Tax=Timema cristinae TaxID=61476 RepID=A0A7R9D5C0_TIMCR|nr:unnamed protein product [Timema cristinae]